MTLDQHSYPLSVEERMHKVYERMRLERISGIAAANKEGFLAFCREQENSGAIFNAQDKQMAEAPDYNEINWGDFGDWNDGPGFSLERRKVKVS